MNVITHRGLDPSIQGFPMESSIEAFRNQLERGYGLEFDVRRTQDDRLVVIHDGNLKRASGGADTRDISAIPLAEILEMDFNGSHLASFAQVLQAIAERQREGSVSAIHLKSGSQDTPTLDLILADLKRSSLGAEKFVIFDVKIETAKYLKQRMPELHLVPSVAHSYDIERYNGVVGGTLLSVEEALTHRDLFYGVWLDEWDLADKDGGRKKFYTPEVFKVFQSAGLWVALVTPELHGTSPGLLGGEAHEDAHDHSVLMNRIKEILALSPDAVCTDFPDEVVALD